ncbi:MAG TPA: RDD family protein [Chthonomonadaceae bacterium]|nr:RDD family protein [Chthonomonadaceae bacterium]
MSRTITVITPENITITYRLAGVASRFIAFLIDAAIQMVMVLATVLIIGRVTMVPFLGSFVTAAGIIGIFLIVFVYKVFFEMLWGGRTPGKRLLGLRVIREGGYPINLPASAARSVLQFIDLGIIPISLTSVVMLWGLPGLLCIFFSPTYKRIGDFAAGTVVIVEAPAIPFGAERPDSGLRPEIRDLMPLVKNLDRLTVEEYRLIRRFTSRRAQLELTVQASVGERLAGPLMQKLEMDIPVAYQVQYANILEAIERKYAEERGIL